MKKEIVLIVCALLLWQAQVSAQSEPHPPRCGTQQLKNAMIAKDSAWVGRFAAQRNALQGIANDYIAQQQPGKAEKTTTISAVPVIFHIIVDSAQFNLLGGTAGIMIRCDSQIAVLNHDFNKHNGDSGAIPSLWKPLYGDPGIKFGLARIDPSANCSPGYEIKIIPGTTDSGFDNVGEAFPEAKTAATGLASWDVTKYYNVWCINYTGAAQNLLGLTVPLSYTGPEGQPVDQEGVCILYNTLGCTAADGTPPANTGGAAGWPYPYNFGRTLTHETGHFFEIWHPWGDDGGQCPTWSSDTTINFITCVPGVGYDDGLSDTPPESDAVFGNPAYNVPNGTETDCCQWHGPVNTQPIGIACISYMDYTDDDAMHLFTPMQAAAMASMVLVPPTGEGGADGEGTVGENYSLTQHPNLLVCDTTTAVNTPTGINSELNIFPNPTTGQVTITLNSSAETISQIMVINILGQEVMAINGRNKDYYSINLSGMSKGIYFIKCNFASGSITRKILLQ